LQTCGVHRLTISPKLLGGLTNDTTNLTKKLDAAKSKTMDIPKIEMTESKFRWMLNEDAMGTEKLAEGTRGFTKDIVKLEEIVQTKIDARNKRRKISHDNDE